MIMETVRHDGADVTATKRLRAFYLLSCPISCTTSDGATSGGCGDVSPSALHPCVVNSEQCKLQLQKLYEWLHRYVRRHGLNPSDTPCKQICNVRGGAAILECPISQFPNPDSSLAIVESDSDIPESWRTSEGCIAVSASVAEDEDFQRAALRVRSPLERLWCSVGSHTTSDAAFESDEQLAVLLFNTISLHADYTAEVCSDSTAAAIRCQRRRDVSAPAALDGRPSKQSIKQMLSTAAFDFPKSDSIYVTPRTGGDLLNNLSVSDEQFLAHSSWWVWNHLFFSSVHKRLLAAPGTIIVKDVAATFSNLSPRSAMRVVDAPFILSTLAALRVRYGPSSTLQPGSFVLFELHDTLIEQKKGEETTTTWLNSPEVTVGLLATPFPWAREGHPEWFSVSGMVKLVQDLPLASLRHVVAPSATKTQPKYGALDSVA